MTIRPLVFALLLVAAGVLGGAAAFGLQVVRGGGTGSDVRAYLLANPDVIPEAMQRLQDRETGKAVAQHRAAIVDPFPGAISGNPNGKTTVVAYMDYACGYCRHSLPAIAELVAADSDIRIVYRELPVLSEESRVAAAWSLAAAEQGKFMPFHEALYAAGRLSEATIRQAAATARLDVARAERYAQSAPVQAEIGKNLQIASMLGMSGTPAWVVGNRVLAGAQTKEQLAEAVKAARES